jgi:hypothetical protein
MKDLTMNKVTIVTGLWDIGRNNLSNDWARSMDHYLQKFDELLKIDENMIIFGDENLQKFVSERRSNSNTQFILRNTDWFRNNDYYDLIQKIRTDDTWLNQTGWIKDSTQAKLEYYNPLVMSKMFLLNDARIMDKFDTEYMFWLDAGITNTVHPGYFTHDKVFNNIDNQFDKFSFITFPYEGASEIHGFNIEKLNKYADNDVKLVARGGFFGGHKSTIEEINGIYYGLLTDTLSNSLMGTEESIFSIITYKHSDKVNHFDVEYNGLIGKFFEELKNKSVLPKQVEVKLSKDMVVNYLDTSKVGLYVLTFNSPNQFETLIQSMLEYDSDFINKPKKFLLDNSTDLSTTPRYIELCKKYNFEHIKKNNLGIMGGRIFVAEHFDKTDLDYQIFFEDDMNLYPKKGEVCRNGFPRYVDNLYQKSLEIITKENFDFLKYSFTEFYGSNDEQFAWYNVPQDFRQSHWLNNHKLPVQGFDPNVPRTEIKNIKIHKGLPYVNGEIYLCNWPIVLTKNGNYKCYLETKWGHPYEQTLMSYSYQETVKGNIKPGLLLLTPIEHDRFHHYAAELRKES